MMRYVGVPTFIQYCYFYLLEGVAPCAVTAHGFSTAEYVTLHGKTEYYNLKCMRYVGVSTISL